MSSTTTTSSSSIKLDGGGNNNKNADEPTPPTTTTAEKVRFEPSPKDQWTMICQGSEAKVWRLTGKGKNDDDDQEEETWMICKERFSKSYRHPALDERLTRTRCRSEAKILEKCTKKRAKNDNNSSKDGTSSILLRVPKVIRVIPPLLYMEYIHGITLKEYLYLQNNTDNNTDIKLQHDEIATVVGTTVGILHNMSIVHGDLTTANMIVVVSSEKEDEGNNITSTNTTTISSSPDNNETSTTPNDETNNDAVNNNIKIVMIDFGLSKLAATIEEMAVDLYVLERALQSTHPELSETSFFETLLKSYYETVTTATTSGNNGGEGGENETTNNNSSNKKKKNTQQQQQSVLQRLEQVRLRGRKRECFG